MLSALCKEPPVTEMLDRSAPGVGQTTVDRAAASRGGSVARV